MCFKKKPRINNKNKVSFIMSYKYNGSMIQIAHPVQSISVNKHRVIFSDTQGLKNALFQKASDARQFVKWLKAS
ncbi:MAG: hypothetical protein ACI87I_002610 [Pseudoalteromonas tetraodonis]|jgi:hypothetical protein|nr:hypothetical protein [Pseudoalteromonas sp.]OLF80030.1 hypothetical protein AWH60_01230 [Pseudoalteromonas haloplanktis]PWS56223.1 hypothetical protein DK924_05660 [Pseudoalteromonas sp. meg-B1]QBJ63014.1 hypothetical protein B1F84_08165 [Pseudoalteromonas sp. DL-6]TMO22825.1 hypothetical protein CWC30_10445 [Pseudoalteromonas sp. S4741]|tara:strand:- start:1131 stop:1352 length:222 start_codon:yes stop_codon:yes gene_type:complete